VLKTSSALQSWVSRCLSEVILSILGRADRSEVVSEFGPKPGPRCRRPLSLGEK
jgi:hypothetical protein